MESTTEEISFKRGFRVPKQSDQLSAIGFSQSENRIPTEYFPFNEFFLPIPKPTDQDDWLAQYKEEGQTFENWKNTPRNRVNQTKKHVYLRTLGINFEEVSGFKLEQLVEFVKVFYPGLSIKTMEPLNLEEDDEGLFIEYQKNTRRATTQHKKLYMNKRKAHPYKIEDALPDSRQLGVDILLGIIYDTMPSDAFCVLAVTMEDLFEGKKDEFVVGMASPETKAGIFSFARYNPNFGKETKRSKQDEKILFQRSCKVLVHELGHLFNIDHCIFYFCCMNGAGHLREDYKQPLHFCPVCLRKLQAITNCDIAERYEGLKKYYSTHEFLEEEKWIAGILNKISELKGKSSEKKQSATEQKKKRTFVQEEENVDKRKSRRKVAKNSNE